MPEYKLTVPNSEEAFDILITKIEPKYIEIAFEKSNEAAKSIASVTSLKKYPFLEITQTVNDNSAELTVAGLRNNVIRTPPASFVKIGDHNLKTYRVNFDTATTAFRSQLNLNRASENEKANIARYLRSINDINFEVQRDKMKSANKNADAVKSLL